MMDNQGMSSPSDRLPGSVTSSEPGPEDLAVLAGYGQWADKGEAVSGYRVTIMSARTSYQVGEHIRVVHLCESTSAENLLYVMGPKAVWSEYLDGELATSRPPPGEDGLVPGLYDGRALPGPGVDTNYDVTVYRLERPGRHQVQWRPGANRSNVLWFDVA